MATISAVVVPAKVLADGKHKIRIAIAHNGTTRYLPTDIKVSSKEFKNGAVVKRPDAPMLNIKLRKLLDKTQSQIDNIDYIDGMTCSELVSFIKYNTQTTISTLGEAYARWKETLSTKKTTSMVHEAIWKSILAEIPSSLPLKNINYIIVNRLLGKWQKEKKSKGTINVYYSFFQGLISFAIKNGFVEYKRDPFMNIKKPKPNIRQSWLTIEELKRVRDTPLSRIRNHSRQLFMLSFYLGGLNFIDICTINFLNTIKTGKLIYKRTKTKDMENASEVEFGVPHEAIELLKELCDKDGKISLRPSFTSETIGRRMRTLNQALGINQLVFYSARKTFAQIAYEIGIPDSVIDYILGHSPRIKGTVLHHYRHANPKLATEALRKVCDYIK